MQSNAHVELSRRERQIMDVVYRLGRASVAAVREELPDPPSYSSVRALLRILEEKGHLRHAKVGLKYVYAPRRPRPRAARTALRQVVRTFFEDSTGKAVAALLDMADRDLTEDEVSRLEALVARAKEEGR